MNYPRPPFPNQQQPMPGATDAMNPVPDHGETTTLAAGELISGFAISGRWPRSVYLKVRESSVL